MLKWGDSMPIYKDYELSANQFGSNIEYTDASAIVLAIRTILLSKPGNFPFNPSLGVNIKKYQFDLLDDNTLADIKGELTDQISKYIPGIDGVKIDVLAKEENRHNYLCIAISVDFQGEIVETNFLISKENEIISVYNETL